MIELKSARRVGLDQADEGKSMQAEEAAGTKSLHFAGTSTWPLYYSPESIGLCGTSRTRDCVTGFVPYPEDGQGYYVIRLAC